MDVKISDGQEALLLEEGARGSDFILASGGGMCESAFPRDPPICMTVVAAVRKLTVGEPGPEAAIPLLPKLRGYVGKVAQFKSPTQVSRSFIDGRPQ